MTSHASHQSAPAPFSLADLKDELRGFILGFSSAMEGALSPRGSLGAYKTAEPEAAPVHESFLWKSVLEMYKFGILGNQADGIFGEGKIIDGDHANAEMLLRGLESMWLYLNEKDVVWPRLAIQVVRTAVARHALEGGERYAGYEDSELDYLSFPELALLANMDERSVRNAANPKLPNPLVTVNFGKRTFVERAEAKRWLATRKGFTPTVPKFDPDALMASLPRETVTSVLLPTELAARIEQRAGESGIDVAAYLQDLIQSPEQALPHGGVQP